MVMGRGPVRVVRIWDASFGFGATDWKACIGRASKNSWAKMKGVLLGSIGRSIELGTLFQADETNPTVWYKSNVFAPRHGDSGVLACTSEANINLLEGCISTEQLLLGITQCWAGFHKID